MNVQISAIVGLLVSVAACSSGTSAGDQKVSDSVPASAPALQAETIAPAAHLSPRGVAEAHLVTLAGIAKERNRLAQLGFHSPEEVASASVGEPVPIYRVHVASLRAYRPGDDVGALMVDTETAFLPSVVGGKAVSGTMVGKKDGAWTVTSFGRPTWAKALETTRDRITAARGSAPSGLSFVEVEVPQLVLLVRHVEDGATLLTSVVDLPTAKLKAGEPIPAADAFARLQAMAN